MSFDITVAFERLRPFHMGVEKDAWMVSLDHKSG
jgi:hypothetical protein